MENKHPSMVFTTTNAVEEATTQTIQTTTSLQDSPFVREKLQKLSEKVATKRNLCRGFTNALTRYCDAHEQMARESERFAREVEVLEVEMFGKESGFALTTTTTTTSGGGANSIATNKSIEEETRTDMLVTRVRESAEAHSSFSRDARETVGHMLEVFGTHECERQKAKQSVFAKTVEKVERERSKHARSNSSVSKMKFSEAASATDLARFELMACLQRGVHESESVVEKVTVEMVKRHLEFIKNLGGNLEVEDGVKEREEALRGFEEEVEKMMGQFRQEVDAYAMENGFSGEHHDAVVAGMISPVSEGEDLSLIHI